jgi:hypothetical protein
LARLGLRPHRAESSKFSTARLFIDKSLNVNDMDDPAESVDMFSAFEELSELVRGQELAAIAGCARLQHRLRDNVLSTQRSDTTSMANHLKETVELLKAR